MEPTTLSFEDFWQWLLEHHNCILRAGTPETILYDEEEFHWNLTGNEAGNRVVQVVWGKRLLGELVVEPDLVTCVVGRRVNTKGRGSSSSSRILPRGGPRSTFSSWPMAMRRTRKPLDRFINTGTDYSVPLLHFFNLGLGVVF